MATLTIFTAILFVTSTWAAAEEKVLHNFNADGIDGENLRRADLRCRRQSLRHHLRWRHFQQRDAVRVDARSGRNLDGEGAA
jgi:hypothetical protein